jgi:hypothetical protein
VGAPGGDGPVLELNGRIAASGFGSGDRFVVGLWDEGPLGAMTDVMWANPAGRRTLLAPDRGVAEFVGGIYDFDEVRVVTCARVHRSAQGLALSAGPLELEMEPGPSVRLFGLRPAWLRRRRAWVRFEDALLRPLMGELVLRGARGVRSYGVSPSGVREWYRIEGYSPARRARASLDGTDLGDMGPLVPAVRFGFSEFPREPAFVRCSPLLSGAERFLTPQHG